MGDALGGRLNAGYVDRLRREGRSFRQLAHVVRDDREATTRLACALGAFKYRVGILATFSMERAVSCIDCAEDMLPKVLIDYL